MLPAAFLDRPIAHRALHDVTQGRPENSLPAIEAAIAAGYGIEIDIQASKDGAAFVFHDYDMARLTGQSGAIQSRRQSEVKALRLVGSDDAPPLLSEVLSLVNGRVPLLIELKDQDGAMGANVGPLEESVAKLLESYAGAVAVMSFNPNSVAAFSKSAPKIRKGLVSSAYHADDWPTLPAKTRAALAELPFDPNLFDFISHDRQDLSNPRIETAKTAGLPILCWTVRTPEEEAEARKFADNITFEGYLA